jgi:hypothetical protein
MTTRMSTLARKSRTLIFSLLTICCFATGLEGAEILTAAPDYLATDLFHDNDDLNSPYPGAFCWYDNSVAMIELGYGGLQVINPNTGAIEYSLGQPNSYLDNYTTSSGYSAYPSFMKSDPSGDSFWVGFTVGGNTDDRIYQVGLDGTWTHKASLTGNYDLEFSGENIFAVGNLGATNDPFLTNTAIYALDTTGTNPNNTGAHTEIAQVGGYGAGMGVDPDGNIYYGIYDYATPQLIEFSATDINGVLTGGSPLTTQDATVLADLDFGPADIAVDPTGLLMLGSNDFSGETPGQIFLYDKETQTLESIAETTGSDSYWLQGLSVRGNINGPDGAILTSDYYQSGLGQITSITSIYLPGDANNDSQVTTADLAAVTGNWQQEVDGWSQGDFNGDGLVTTADLAAVTGNWQSTPTSVPEPSSLVLLFLIPCTLFYARRRIGPAPNARHLP